MADQARVTFTSSEVGNGNPNDSGTMNNQDGFLAVRFQPEDATGNTNGPIQRFSDENFSLTSDRADLTYDVRDLVSGVQRGDQFRAVVLGTQGDDFIPLPGQSSSNLPTYYNLGQGNDFVFAGSGNDFLVGGAGNDALSGGFGNDSFIGGAGNDTIDGDAGDDTVIVNVSTDGADAVNTGLGADRVNVSAAAAGQIRLSFTSSEVGNASALDSNSMANQDGGLAVRLQAEASDGTLTGPVSRYDDEGVTFVASTASLTFDVRDIVAGTQRGDQFRVVALGTNGNDTIMPVGGYEGEAHYVNAGQGNDTVTGGSGNDFLVGGAGNDVLNGAAGNDAFLGGAGDDILIGDTGADFLSGDAGNDRLSGGADNDTLLGGAGNDELGGDAGDDVLVGDAGADTLFGGAGGDRMNGGADNDILIGAEGGDELGGGTGDDLLSGGADADSLFGEEGNDTLDGGTGNDTLIGGAGADQYNFGTNSGADIVVGFSSAEGDRLALFGQTYTVGRDEFGNAQLALSGGGSVTLAGVGADQVNAGLFA